MSRTRYPVRRNKRTGLTHLVEEVEGIAFTLCGKRCARHFVHTSLSMEQADCVKCWNSVGSRITQEKRAARRAEMRAAALAESCKRHLEQQTA